MPKPVPFTEERTVATSDAGPIGMRLAGTLKIRSRRARWENALVFIPFLYLQLTSDVMDTRSGTVDANKLGLVVLGFLGLGALAVGLPALFIRNNSFTLTLERPDGQRFRVTTTSREVATRLKDGSSTSQGNFRPQVVDQGEVQIELRNDWKGNGGRLVYIPESVSEAEIEEHVHRFLPSLAETLDRDSR